MLPAFLALAFQSNLAEDISKLLDDPALARAAVGVYAKEVGGRELFSFNADKRFMPASTMKLVTAATALDSLGPDCRPVTTVWRGKSAVYILGGADPGLTYGEIVKLGVRVGAKEEQRVFFDDSLLGKERIGSGWEFGDLGDGYAASVSALTVNRGVVEVWSTGGAPMLRPRNFGLGAVWRERQGEVHLHRAYGDTLLRITGAPPKGSAKLGEISLPDPAFCAASILGRAERQIGLASPDGAIAFAPRSVADLLHFCLVESDNLYAETLLRLAGARAGKSGSWADSLALSEAMLLKAGVDKEAFRLSDGSGLSRFNELSPRCLAQVLESHPLLEPLLARPGEGTLKGRLMGLALSAKTGTLTGVSCIAGVIGGQRRVVFAVMFNHYSGTAKKVREIHDAIISRLSRP